MGISRATSLSDLYYYKERRKFNMELDAKQKVLMAIYSEYQKDVPSMKEITFGSLDMDCQVFKIALDKLQNEGLILGAKLHFRQGSPHPDTTITNFIKMTREGIEFVEEKMEIQRFLSGREKVEMLRQKFGKLGWESLSEFAAKVLIEVSKQVVS